MSKFSMLVSGLLTCVLLASCSAISSIFPTSQPPKHELPKLVGDWHISMAQSGGIAGRDLLVGITNNGEMTVTDKRTNKQSTVQLAADKITDLVGLVASSKYQPSSGPTAACADCFIYNLEISSGGQKFLVQLNDISLPDSGLQPLINFLGKLLE